VEATVILKQNPATSGIPIVVLTAMAFGEWKTKALHLYTFAIGGDSETV
jgi:CheY-like chemotaxis protein